MFAFCIGLSACATPNQMGITTKSASVDVSQKSLLLMTLSLSHPGATIRSPKLIVLGIKRPNAQDKAERQNFLPDNEGQVSADGRTTYEMRMAIAPGYYIMVAGEGFIRVFRFSALLLVPLELDFTVPENSVIYLGDCKH